jgi:hypothetical protein
MAALEEADEEDDDLETRMTGDDDDPIVRTIPILATKTLSPYLHFFAFPARKGKDAFESANRRETARIKRETGQIEMDLTVADTHSPHYNADRGKLWTDQPLRTISLGGQVRPLHHLHGWYNRGALHVTPVDKFVQMRPKLAHIDAHDKEDKEAKRLDALGDKPSRAAKAVQLSAKSTDAVAPEQATTSALLRLVEEEMWTDIDWNGETDADSWHHAESLMTGKKQACKSLTNEEQYLQMLSTVRFDGSQKNHAIKIEI